MMNYGTGRLGMMGGFAGVGAFFMILFYLIVLIDLILAGIALWKYITKK